jgi:hypothetical protein
MLMSDDNISHIDLYKRILSDSTIRSQRFLRRYDKQTIRSNYGTLVEILNQEQYISMKTAGPGSERESSSIRNVDVFKFLRFYKGFKDHLLDVRGRIIISRLSILKNP